MPDSVFLGLQKLSHQDITALSDEEIKHLERVVKEGEYGTTFFSGYENFDDILNRFWDDAVPPEAYHLLNKARWHLSDDYEVDSGIRFSLREPDWYIGFSAEFVKSIAKIDKNKRARVLEAISKLTESPITPHGDTIKPLTGDLAGLWRYRIGDDRLVYKANSQSQRVVLISFGARGGIYE
ncbi:MAG: type II toxin-antitoxin system RelE/ParE family toxin [Methylobacter sp.]|nr:MAG: type II toxin-antitoxin system RelE/ParE family toxin [Methylobacter sp.]